MRRDTRKQPWQTFPFWFLILSGMAMTVAWKLDLLRPQPPAVAVEEEPAVEELAPDWASETASEEDVAATEEQSEPVLEGEAPRSFPDSEEGELASTSEPEEASFDNTTDESASPATNTQSHSRENPFSRTDARLVSAHRETAPAKTLSSIAAPPAAEISLKTTNPPSPFGPAKVEFQGVRTAKSAGRPAENAAWARETGNNQSASETNLQTAAVDSSQSLAAAGKDQSAVTSSIPPTLKPRAAATDEPIDFVAIDQLIADGEDVEANFQLSNLYWKRPEIRKQLDERLRTVSYRIYFAPQPHYMEGHVVEANDVLQNIAKDYGVSWEYLAKLNRTDPKKIRPGQKLKVIRGPFAAVVDLSDREMTVHSHGHYVARFVVGIGQDNSSPIGTFKVQEKLRDPTYYGADGVIEHDDPQNPLGEHWLDLGDSYGIHGTNDEATVGKTESRGCIRMKNRDIADVYDLLTTGSEVLIRR